MYEDKINILNLEEDGKKKQKNGYEIISANIILKYMNLTDIVLY